MCFLRMNDEQTKNTEVSWNDFSPPLKWWMKFNIVPQHWRRDGLGAKPCWRKARQVDKDSTCCFECRIKQISRTNWFHLVQVSFKFQSNNNYSWIISIGEINCSGLRKVFPDEITSAALALPSRPIIDFDNFPMRQQWRWRFSCNKTMSFFWKRVRKIVWWRTEKLSQLNQILLWPHCPKLIDQCFQKLLSSLNGLQTAFRDFDGRWGDEKALKEDTLKGRSQGGILAVDCWCWLLLQLRWLLWPVRRTQ